MAKAVRMADIAQRLGVSTVTVSKALADQKGVSEEMRERIKALAEEMGYRTPSAARAERRQRSYNIGILVAETYINNYDTFYWELYQKINTGAGREHCFVILEVLESDMENGLMEPRMLLEDKIDGLMVLGRVQTKYLQMLKKKYISMPMVYMDFYDKEVKADCVISNSFYGTYQITNYLFEMGHTRIGFVGRILATESIMDRFLGYQKALMEHEQRVREDWVISDRDQHIFLYEKIPLPQEMPTAFVCNSDLTASRMIKNLREAGYKVPEDISVVGYDDWLHPGLCDIGITTYSVDMDTMAKTGLKLLLHRMDGRPERGGMQVVEGNMVIRESVKCEKKF